MSAKIYQSPIDEPVLDWKNPNAYAKEEEKFKAELKEYLQVRNKTGKNVGEVIRFQVADGYAEYMVASMRPLELVHLNLLDGYNFQHIDLMTAKAVQEKIDQQKALDKLFSDNKNNKSK